MSEDVGDLAVYIGLVEGGGWMVGEKGLLGRLSKWGVGRFIWVVRCLEVWLGKDVGDLAVYFGLGRRSEVVRR